MEMGRGMRVVTNALGVVKAQAATDPSSVGLLVLQPLNHILKGLFFRQILVKHFNGTGLVKQSMSHDNTATD